MIYNYNIYYIFIRYILKKNRYEIKRKLSGINVTKHKHLEKMRVICLSEQTKLFYYTNSFIWLMMIKLLNK